MSFSLSQCLTAFFVTLISIIIFAKLAPLVNLVDKPEARKRHKGEIPLIGGLAIFTALLVGATIWGDSYATVISANGKEALDVFIIAGALLVATGAIDDRFKLGVFVRIISEVAVALIIIEGLDLNLRNLGSLIGPTPIELPVSLAYPFTIVAIVGLINAFNMLDGLDGLLASLVIFTLLNFHIFTQTAPGIVSIFIGASLLAFLISNLSISPLVPYTFLGDAGSRLLGFIVVCLLLSASSGQVGASKMIQPVTALYVVALPLFDMFFTVLRRLLRNRSPFEPDRSHIHHLLQDLGISNRRALVIIVCVGSIVPSLGLLINRLGASEMLQFYLFLICFLTYCFLMSQAWFVAKLINQTQVNDENEI